METFGNRLKKLIADNDLTINKLANSIGLTPRTISKIVENKTKYPSIDILQKVSTYFNISADWLLLGKGEPNPAPTVSEDAAYEVYVDVLKQEYFASRTELEAARTIIESQKQTIEQLKAQLGFDSNVNPKNKGNNTPKKANAAGQALPDGDVQKKHNKKRRTHVAQTYIIGGLSI